MTSIFTYSGKEPSVHSPEQIAKILEIMLEQLKVLQALSATRIFIPAGTRVSEVMPEGEEQSNG